VNYESARENSSPRNKLKSSLPRQNQELPKLPIPNQNGPTEISEELK